MAVVDVWPCFHKLSHIVHNLVVVVDLTFTVEVLVGSTSVVKLFHAEELGDGDVDDDMLLVVAHVDALVNSILNVDVPRGTPVHVKVTLILGRWEREWNRG